MHPLILKVVLILTTAVPCVPFFVYDGNARCRYVASMAALRPSPPHRPITSQHGNQLLRLRGGGDSYSGSVSAIAFHKLVCDSWC